MPKAVRPTSDCASSKAADAFLARSSRARFECPAAPGPGAPARRPTGSPPTPARSSAAASPSRRAWRSSAARSPSGTRTMRTRPARTAPRTAAARASELLHQLQRHQHPGPREQVRGQIRTGLEGQTVTVGGVRSVPQLQRVVLLEGAGRDVQRADDLLDEASEGLLTGEVGPPQLGPTP